VGEPVVMPVAKPVAVPPRPEGSCVVASSTALGEAGANGQIAAGSAGNLGVGPSRLPDGGASWAVMQRGIPEDFVRAEHEEEEIWQERLNLGGAIKADL